MKVYALKNQNGEFMSVLQGVVGVDCHNVTQLIPGSANRWVELSQQSQILWDGESDRWIEGERSPTYWLTFNEDDALEIALDPAYRKPSKDAFGSLRFPLVADPDDVYTVVELELKEVL